MGAVPVSCQHSYSHSAPIRRNHFFRCLLPISATPMSFHLPSVLELQDRAIKQLMAQPAHGWPELCTRREQKLVKTIFIKSFLLLFFIGFYFALLKVVCYHLLWKNCEFWDSVSVHRSKFSTGSAQFKEKKKKKSENGVYL